MKSTPTPPPTAASIRPPPPRPRVRGWLLAPVKKLARVTAYTAVVTVCLGLLGAHTVEGKAKQAVSAFGDELLHMTDSGAVGAGYAVRLNGQELHVSSGQSKDGVKSVLDRFEQACANGADGLSADFQHLQTALAAPPRVTGFPGVATMREDRGDRGIVACFATGENAGPTGFVGRAVDFARSHDLSAFGEFRYVVARKNAVGGALVVASWTEGKIDLDSMFPDKGDAPGTDLVEVPRPEEARRTLSAEIQGSKYRIRAYQVRQGQDDLLVRYDHVMAKRGWRPAPPGVRRRVRAPHASLFEELVWISSSRPRT